MSEFNCVELTFRYLKHHLYNNLYETIEDEEKDVKLLLENEKIKSTLLQNYKEILQTYLEYSLKYKNKNLNNLDYQI